MRYNNFLDEFRCHREIKIYFRLTFRCEIKDSIFQAIIHCLFGNS